MLPPGVSSLCSPEQSQPLLAQPPHISFHPVTCPPTFCKRKEVAVDPLKDKMAKRPEGAWRVHNSQGALSGQGVLTAAPEW